MANHKPQGPTPPPPKAREPAGRGAQPQARWASQWLASKQRPLSKEITKAGLSRKARVDTTEVMACAKDPSHKGPFYRHHKGFDSLVGQYNKGIGYRYYKWLDCVKLCEDCHCEIHFIYEPYVEKWYNHTPAGAASFRRKLIEVCDDWLLGRIRSPSVPKAYRREFHRSLVRWQKGNEKRGTG